MPETYAPELDGFDVKAREAALTAEANTLETAPSPTPPSMNLHSHTFYSYNGYGYSPTGFAVRARRAGLFAAGIVDFDVLDGVEEFLDAARRLGLRACAGLETRVFVPALHDRVINSPGEPGIAYHMGVGFTSSTAKDRGFLERLAETAGERNRTVVRLVNAHLAPLTIDYEKDVLPMTPSGNATERHICAAYEDAARARFPEQAAREEYWREALGVSAEGELPSEGPDLQALIRSKTMKQGGPGYIQPDTDAFPRLEDVNQFILGEGAVPTLAWLDGFSAGEEDVARLLAIHEAAGTAFVNIIPDRNWNLSDAALAEKKVAKMHAFAAAAAAHGMPLIVGTEMNAYGQRFVDDFDAAPMGAIVEQAVSGAYIAYAHTRLQGERGQGYASEWATTHYPRRDERNAYFEDVGRRTAPGAPPT